MYWLRRLAAQRVVRDKLRLLETAVWGVAEQWDAEDGWGKLWRARVEQDEQPGENFCGIEDGVRTAGTETLSTGLLELWTGILSAAWFDGRSDRSYSTLFGLE